MKAALDIFDTDLLVQRRGASASNLERDGFFFDEAWDRLTARLDDVRRSFASILVLGARHSPLHHKALMERYKSARIVLADVASPLLQRHQGETLLWNETEQSLPRESFDLILCSGMLHTINDVPGILEKMRCSLKPDGLFLAAFPGGRTLQELRESCMAADTVLMGGAGPRVIPFIDRPQAAALMQRAGFALPVVDAETLTVTYGRLGGLLRDLRNMGESNVLRARPATPPLSWLKMAESHYRRNHSESDGRLRAGIEIIFMTGWSPHESQQKPLPRGSGQVNLSDIL